MSEWLHERIARALLRLMRPALAREFDRQFGRTPAAQAAAEASLTALEQRFSQAGTES